MIRAKYFLWQVEELLEKWGRAGGGEAVTADGTLVKQSGSLSCEHLFDGLKLFKDKEGKTLEDS